MRKKKSKREGGGEDGRAEEEEGVRRKESHPKRPSEQAEYTAQTGLTLEYYFGHSPNEVDLYVLQRCTGYKGKWQMILSVLQAGLLCVYMHSTESGLGLTQTAWGSHNSGSCK